MSRQPVIRAAPITRLALVAAVLAVIELAARLEWVDKLTLVPLSSMVSTLWTMLGDGEIWPNLASTGAAIGIAFALAIVSGLAAGYGIWRSSTIFRMVNPYLTSYYAIPAFAFYPILIAIFGYNRVPIVLLAWVYATVAVIINTQAGLAHLPASYEKVVRIYRIKSARAFVRVYLPAAAPLIFNGVKLALSYSIIGVIASEFILSTQGLGWLVSYNYQNFGIAKMYAAMLLIVLLATVASLLIDVVQRRLDPGRRGVRRW